MLSTGTQDYQQSRMIPLAKILCDGVYAQTVGGIGSKEKKIDKN